MPPCLTASPSISRASAGFVEAKPTPPFFVLHRCRELFVEWLAKGAKGAISFDPVGLPPDRKELFLREWNARLDATRQKLKAPADCADAELWAGVKECLEVAQQARHVRPGVEFGKLPTASPRRIADQSQLQRSDRLAHRQNRVSPSSSP